MQNLIIPINNKNSTPTVNARNLHVFLQSKQDFSTWIKNRIKQYDFIDGEDFTKVHKKMELSKTGQNSIEYHISLDMAKELSMVEKTEKGKEARRYFIEQEKKLNEVSLKLQSNDPILMLAQSTSMLREEQIRQSEKLKSLETKVEQIEANTADRKLIVNDPPAGYENKENVIKNVAKITQSTQAIVAAVLDVYLTGIKKKRYLVERIDDLQIVQTWPTAYFTYDVIQCVKHAIENSVEQSECFRIFNTLGHKRMKYMGVA